MLTPNTLLLIMAPERRTRLVPHLESLGSDLVTASSCEEALELLRRIPGPTLVLTDQKLPDGCWSDVLTLVDRENPGAGVIVCVLDERLWIPALEAGALDVLPEPFHHSEVRRIVGSAAARAAVTSLD
jgi:DNA-binding NtrC family response regulator